MIGYHRHEATRAAAALLLAILSPAAQAGEREALAAHGADLTTTAVGLHLGASEANPLGPVLVLAKTAAWAYGRQLPADQQPAYWGWFSAAGWAAGANNLCVIIGIAAGGIPTPVCLAVGAGVATWSWRSGAADRERATFDAICADAQLSQPDLVCVYTPS